MNVVSYLTLLCVFISSVTIFFTNAFSFLLISVFILITSVFYILTAGAIFPFCGLFFSQVSKRVSLSQTPQFHHREEQKSMCGRSDQVIFGTIHLVR